MKHVSILVPEQAVLASITDPKYMFTAVNNFMAANGNNIPFKIHLVGNTREVKLDNGSFSVHTDYMINEVDHTDLIFIPALSGDMFEALAKNKDLFPWIQQHYKKGAEVVSLCVGAFMLASTGLLDGKECSTHWMSSNEFRQMFPNVKLKDDKIITEELGIYTSGGATSYWNLLLYLIEKYTSREVAIMASKFFVIDIDRNSQSPFIIFQGQKKHEDENVLKAQEFIELNYRNKLTVDEISKAINIGRRSLERRFKRATQNTISEYIQRVKIEASKKSFETSKKNINEVMYDVGYSDTKAFRILFKKLTGLSPVEYRNKYQRILTLEA